jgi:hypothetical protein
MARRSKHSKSHSIHSVNESNKTTITTIDQTWVHVSIHIHVCAVTRSSPVFKFSNLYTRTLKTDDRLRCLRRDAEEMSTSVLAVHREL